MKFKFFEIFPTPWFWLLNFFPPKKCARAAKNLTKRVKIGLNLGTLVEFGQKWGYNVSILGELLPQGEFFPTRGGAHFLFHLPVVNPHFWQSNTDFLHSWNLWQHYMTFQKHFSVKSLQFWHTRKFLGPNSLIYRLFQNWQTLSRSPGPSGRLGFN